MPRTGRSPVENPIFFSWRSFARQVSRLFGTSRAGRSSCFSKPQVDSLLQNCLVAKVLKVYSLRLQSAHYSLKWATDKFRWRAFGALPTIRASPEGPPIGRLRMAVCPCPVEGPGGVATGGARRSGRLIGNCRAQAPRPGNVGVAGRGSDRPTDWRIPPWHQLECRKPSSGSMSGNRPTGHASRLEMARCC